MTNIVLLTIDSLRVDHCSSYGYDRGTTPNLDAFAAEGVRFENAYSASSHTREAVPAFLTGEYPHAAINESYHLSKPSLATLLKETHSTGAFHSNPFISRAYGYDRDFDAFDDDLYFSQHKLVALAQRFWDEIRGHHYARAETINERALAWLDSLPDGERFFLWNHYMDAHGPYEPPEPYRSEFGAGGVDTANAQDLWDSACETPEEISASERESLVNLYDGEIAYLDAQIGAFLDKLEYRGELNDTVVIVTSDHGDLFGEDETYSHPRSIHKRLLHVPLLVSGLNAPEVAVDAPVTLLDIVPTVCSAAGANPGDVPGVALQDVWHDPSSFADRHVISEVTGEAMDGRQYRVISKDDSLTYEQTLDGETTVPGDDSSELVTTLQDHLQSVGTIPNETAGAPERDDDLASRLEALGYK